MSTQLQLRRDNNAINQVFTGAEGELTVNLDTKELHVHDGVKQGGYPVVSKDALADPAGAELVGYGGSTVGQHLDDLAAPDSSVLVGGVEVSDLVSAATGAVQQSDLGVSPNLVRQAALSVGNNTYPVMWNPGPQPPARTDRPGFFFNAFQSTADDAINQLWEPLRAMDPEYITRTNLGKDQSGLYDVWRYEFTPPNYDRTIILNGALHGSEVTGMLAVYLMLKKMMESWETEPQLAHLRWKTRIIMIPISNPWGFSQLPAKNRLNVNNVNLNRNFDYLWNEFEGTGPEGLDYKGTAPFSEKEAQYVRDTLAEYPDAIAFIDLHNFGSLGEKFPVFLVPEFEDSSDIVTEVIAGLRGEGDDMGITRTYNPYAMAYAAKEYGMHAITVEFADGAYGDSVYSSISMTKAVEWFGNIVLAFARAPTKAVSVKYLSPFCIFAAWSKSTTPITVSSSVYSEIQQFRINLPINQPGYIKLTGYVTGSCNTAGSRLFITPQFGQVGYGKWGPADNIPGGYQGPGNFREVEFESFTSINTANTERVQLNFIAALPVYPTGPYLTSVQIGLRARVADTGTFDFNRYRCMIEFIPSALGDQRCIVKSPNGRETMGLNAMVTTYPKY